MASPSFLIAGAERNNDSSPTLLQNGDSYSVLNMVTDTVYKVCYAPNGDYDAGTNILNPGNGLNILGYMTDNGLVNGTPVADQSFILPGGLIFESACLIVLRADNDGTNSSWPYINGVRFVSGDGVSNIPAILYEGSEYYNNSTNLTTVQAGLEIQINNWNATPAVPNVIGFAENLAVNPSTYEITYSSFFQLSLSPNGYFGPIPNEIIGLTGGFITIRSFSPGPPISGIPVAWTEGITVEGSAPPAPPSYTLVGQIYNQVQEQQSELDALNLLVEPIAGEIATLQGQVSGIESSVGTLQEEMLAVQGQVSTLEGSVSTLQGEMLTVQGQVSTLEGQVSTLEGSVSTLQGEMLTVQGQVSTLEGSVSTLQGEMLTVQDQVATLEGSVSTLQTDVSTLQGEMISVEQGVAGRKSTNIAIYANSIQPLPASDVSAWLSVEGSTPGTGPDTLLCVSAEDNTQVLEVPYSLSALDYTGAVYRVLNVSTAQNHNITLRFKGSGALADVDIPCVPGDATCAIRFQGGVVKGVSGM